ncbi:DUF2971 domain-containing protein [Pseudomonas syringae]|uniref:DUF2971 domain-containing protein n=1 Tax=Pseudomonas syringae TaxID=317 RepID=UPI000E3295A0|nr:DUF2971 domain-containing protein [Pseudomonas syringae]
MQLFHYTDVNAVKSILENRILMLTDVRYLNDSEEMHDGIATIIDLVKHEVAESSDEDEFFMGAGEYIESGLVGKAGYGIENRPVFICSFSSAGDLLSQWRAYGSYAIEFAASAIPHSLSACIYDEFTKTPLALAAAAKSLAVISEDMLRNDGHLDREGLESFSDLVGLAATYKHESFSEEQEFRIIVGHNIDPQVEDGLKVLFRPRGDMLVPYVELEFPLESITAIHVGPMRDQELAFISMKAFVDKLNLDLFVKDNTYLHDIAVIKSSIPYRAP